jgi:hypothetical protein
MQGGAVKTRPLRPLEAVRAFGVMLGGSIALAAAAAASTVAVARALVSLRRPSLLALVGSAATVVYALVFRPWHLRWAPNRRTKAASCRAMSCFPRAGRRSSMQ